jgi:hypothetical protein
VSRLLGCTVNLSTYNVSYCGMEDNRGHYCRQKRKTFYVCMDNFIKEVPVGLDVSPAMSVENLAAVSAR